jgi:putative drug exporter of the RND superfamily
VETGGDALNTPASDTGVIHGLAVAVVVLLLTFGSLAAAGLPLPTAGISVGLRLAHG